MQTQTIHITTTQYSANSVQTRQAKSSMDTMGAGTAEQIAEMVFGMMDQSKDISLQGSEILVRHADGTFTYYVYEVVPNESLAV